eukprot:gene10573-11695_t
MQPKNQMIQRWMCEIQGYSFIVKHRVGTTNGNADALSRYPITSDLQEQEGCESKFLIAALEAIDISHSQDEDSDVKELKDFLSHGILPSEERSSDRTRNFSSQYILEEDVLYHLWSPKVKGVLTRPRKQLVVPKKEIGKLLVYGHDKLGHPGFMRTFSRLRDNYFWVCMKKDVARHCKNCKSCAARKSPKRPQTVPLNPIKVQAPLEIVGINFVGPLPVTTKGNRYVLTMQDHFTRFPAAYALEEANEYKVIECIQSFANDFGYPKTILSDRGAAFLSDLVKRACRTIGINHSATTSYHPQANGLCERFHSTLKTALSLVIDKGKTNWDVFLPDMVTAYRTTPHTVAKETPVFLMFGRQFKVPPSVQFQAPVRLYTDDFVTERQNNLRQAYELVRELNQTERDRHKAIYDKKHTAEECEFKAGDSVYLKAGEKKTGLDRNHWEGPYIVEKIISKENVKLQMGNSRRHPVVHVNRLKPDKADNPEKVCEEVVEIMDKMRSRNDKGRLETKYFVLLRSGESLWMDDAHLPNELLETYNRK